VRVVARGHPGGDPVAVRVGNTMFALRRFEAERVLVAPLRKGGEHMSTANMALRLALLGNPNCGKTALFNLLTGSRQKVANYPGVTVDRKEGQLTTPAGKQFRVLDLPGAYSLNAVSIDEEITRDVVLGTLAGEPASRPARLRQRRHQPQAQPAAGARGEAPRAADGAGAQHDRSGEQARHRDRRAGAGPRVGHAGGPHHRRQRGGASELISQLEAALPDDVPHPPAWLPPDVADVTATQREVRRILAATVREPALDTRLDERIDRVVLHPVWGMLILAATLFLMFQAVFSWANACRWI
jgi:ferrous iron transport protein B